MDSSLKKALKATAHHLKPVVLVGSKGLTPAVIAEADVALLAHELIKVKIQSLEKAERQALCTALCHPLHAQLVQLIGNTAIIYRKNNDKIVPKR